MMKSKRAKPNSKAKRNSWNVYMKCKIGKEQNEIVKQKKIQGTRSASQLRSRLKNKLYYGPTKLPEDKGQQT